MKPQSAADMYKYGQAEIAAVAGYDAATFMRVFAFGKSPLVPNSDHLHVTLSSLQRSFRNRRPMRLHLGSNASEKLHGGIHLACRNCRA